MAELRQLVGAGSPSVRSIDKLVEEQVLKTIQQVAVLRRVVPTAYPPRGSGAEATRPAFHDAATIPYPQVESSGKISSGKVLVPVLLRVTYQVESSQEKDEAVVRRLAVRAARELGKAEDLVILYGKHAKTDLKLMPNVDAENLDDKEGLLPSKTLKDCTSGVFDAIATAIGKLKATGSEYRAVVSSALFFEARKAVAGAVPLDQIHGLLGSEFFERSTLLDTASSPRCGVVMCVTGEPVDLAFADAPSIKYQGHVKGAVEWAIEERFALRILEPDAVAPISE